MPSRRAAGDLESEVLAALWAANRPVTVAEVVDAVDSTLAHNTVQTILTRLNVKGAVARERIGRAHAYTPVLDDAGMIANRMRAALDKGLGQGQDHVAVLSHFVDTLTPDEESALAALLAQHRDEDPSP